MLRIRKFRVLDNPDLSINEMITEGKYDHVDPSILGYFYPNIKGAGKRKFWIVNLGRASFDQDVIENFEKLGLVVASFRELLAFGKGCPHIQESLPVVELGFPWPERRGNHQHACLWSSSGGRGLYLLGSLTDKWCSGTGFIGLEQTKN